MQLSSLGATRKNVSTTLMKNLNKIKLNKSDQELIAERVRMFEAKSQQEFQLSSTVALVWHSLFRNGFGLHQK